jgi:TetR/AcrR family transcriptional regulator, repressor for uid operon
LQHGAPARERIIAAAKRLFSERGFHKTAMADLALDAGVSVGAIYRSFASKAEIIRAIVQTDTQETLRKLRTDIDQVRRGEVSGPAAVERMMGEWTTIRDEALNHEIVAEGYRDPEVAEVISSVGQQYGNLFRDLIVIVRPGSTDERIEVGVEILLACMFGMGHRAFTRPRLDNERTAALLTDLIFRGLSS